MEHDRLKLSGRQNLVFDILGSMTRKIDKCCVDELRLDFPAETFGYGTELHWKIECPECGSKVERSLQAECLDMGSGFVTRLIEDFISVWNLKKSLGHK